MLVALVLIANLLFTETPVLCLIRRAGPGLSGWGFGYKSITRKGSLSVEEDSRKRQMPLYPFLLFAV